MQEELGIMAKEGQLDDTERPPREEFDSDVHFFGEFDVVKCRGLNISSGGVAFRLEQPLTFQMRFIKEGVSQEHRARLVWARRSGEPGEIHVGFEFDNEGERAKGELSR